jgi:hypothetical protein
MLQVLNQMVGLRISYATVTNLALVNDTGRLLFRGAELGIRFHAPQRLVFAAIAACASPTAVHYASHTITTDTNLEERLSSVALDTLPLHSLG